MYVSRTPPPPLPQPSVKLRQSLWRAFRVKTGKVASPPCSGGRKPPSGTLEWCSPLFELS